MLSEKTFSQLTLKQKKAIPLLASGLNGKDVADALKCNPATISQWLNHDKQFTDALNAFTEGSIHFAQVQIQFLGLQAVEELRRLLHEAKSEQVRIKAVELILTSVGLAGTNITTKRIKDFDTEAARYDFDKLLEAVSG